MQLTRCIDRQYHVSTQYQHATSMIAPGEEISAAGRGGLLGRLHFLKLTKKSRVPSHGLRICVVFVKLSSLTPSPTPFFNIVVCVPRFRHSNHQSLRICVACRGVPRCWISAKFWPQNSPSRAVQPGLDCRSKTRPQLPRYLCTLLLKLLF